MFGVVLNISRQNRYLEKIEKNKNKKCFKNNKYIDILIVIV